MKIVICGRNKLNLQLQNRLKSRFEGYEILLFNSISKAKEHVKIPGDNILTIFEEELNSSINPSIVISYDDTEINEDLSNGFFLMDQVDNLIKFVDKMLEMEDSVLIDEDIDSLSRPGVSSDDNMFSLVDSDAFTIAGNETSEVKPLPSDNLLQDTALRLADLQQSQIANPVENIDAVGEEPQTLLPDLSHTDDSFERTRNKDEFDNELSQSGLMDENQLKKAFMMNEDNSDGVFNEDLPIPGDIATAPGILKRDNKEYTDGFHSDYSVELPVRNNEDDLNDIGLLLRNKYNSKFTGSMEGEYEGNKFILWWNDGYLSEIENYSPILCRILYLNGFEKRVISDISRQTGDPVEIAVKRNLISEENKVEWLEKCREEAVISIIAGQGKLRFSDKITTSLRIRMPLINPLPLILRGVVENYSPAVAYSRCGGDVSISIDDEIFEKFKAWKMVDTMWIRCVELYLSGSPWYEASIKSGLDIFESEALLYGLRLTGVLTPEISGEPNPIDLSRIRIEELLFKSTHFGIQELFGGNGAKARRRYEDIKVFLSNVDPRLASYMQDEITHLEEALKNLIDRS